MQGLKWILITRWLQIAQSRSWFHPLGPEVGTINVLGALGLECYRALQRESGPWLPRSNEHTLNTEDIRATLKMGVGFRTEICHILAIMSYRECAVY